jgi:hypothetical protein
MTSPPSGTSIPSIAMNLRGSNAGMTLTLPVASYGRVVSHVS